MMKNSNSLLPSSPDWFGIPVILGLILIASVMAFDSFPRYDETQRMAPFVYAEPACAYTIRNINGELIPLDQSGKRIGFFERYQDGTVQLTTPSGYAPSATECIRRAGFQELLSSVHPYVSQIE